MKQCAILHLQWDRDGDPTNVNAWRLDRFKDGTQLAGPAVAAFLRRFGPDDVIVLGKWLPRSAMQVLRAIMPAQILFYICLDSVESEPQWAGGMQESLRQLLLPYRLKRPDGTHVNVYEGHPTKAPVHSLLLSSVYMDSVAGLLQAAWSEHLVDGWFQDVVTRFAYYGTASAQPPREDRTLVWPAVFSAVYSRIPKGLQWANTMSVVPFDRFDVDAHFLETPTPKAWNRHGEWLCTAWNSSNGVLIR